MTKPLQRLTVGRNLNGTSAFAIKARRQGAKRLAAQLEKVGERAVSIADEITRAEFITDRPADRRKGGRHLLGSYRHRVVWDGVDFPVRLELFSLADPAKVNALESGADPHTITPVNAVWLVFPKAGGRTTSIGALGDIKFSGVRQPRQAYGGGAKARVKEVHHPGNLPHNMMRRALDRAVDERLARARV